MYDTTPLRHPLLFSDMSRLGPTTNTTSSVLHAVTANANHLHTFTSVTRHITPVMETILALTAHRNLISSAPVVQILH
jgi:hypothetical protein